MQRALPEISRAELSAVVRAVRARPCRDKHLRAAAGAFAAILLIFLHSASVAAWNPSQAPVGAPEENQMLSLRQIAVVSSLAVSSSALAQNVVQWRVQDGGNGHWYALVVQPSTWTAARGAANAAGGHLATMRSSGEGAFIRSIGSSECWIGLYQDPTSPQYSEPAGAWRWVTDEPLDFTNWRVNTNGQPNEPNDLPGGENFGLIDREATTWNDGQDNSLPAYVIEWSADCNGDGLVDFGQIRDGTLADSNSNNIPDCCEQGYDCRFKGTQWRTQDGGNGHWYALVPAVDPFGWTAAKASATAMGGYLATMTSPAENQWVFDHVASARWAWNGTADLHGPWLGAFQDHTSTSYSEPSGGWIWVTGEPWSFTAWNPGLPNNAGPQDFLHFYTTSAVQPGSNWDDIEEDFIWPPIGRLVRAAVVEWSADCNNDGIVDYGQIRDGTLVDTNSNNIPDCCESTQGCNPCPADVDGSGAVNGVDLAAILNVWGTSGGKYPGADVNHDGIVDGADLSEVLNGWGACP